MANSSAVAHLPASKAGADSWTVYTGIARIAILCFVTVGGAYIGGSQGRALLVLYVAWFVVSLLHMRAGTQGRSVGSLKVWLQVVIDFTMVAATVSITHGPTSFFTFIFVMIVLEAGLLLGIHHAFVMATAATMFMAALFLFGQSLMPAEISADFAARGRAISRFELWYSFAIQCLAFYLTAFLSGYWSRRLTRMERFQSEILDNMNSGFLITDENGMVVVQNKAACTILNRTEEASVAAHVSEVLPTESGEECPIVTALRSGKDFTSYEFRARIGGGESRLLGLTTNRIRDNEGKPSGLIASFTDLTVMDELRQENRRQDRFAVVGELAASLAHEIRNPVAVIRGAVDELSSLKEDSDLNAKLYTIALRESDHLNEIVTGFLDFAREPNMKRETFDLREVAEEAQAALEMEFAQNPGPRTTLIYPGSPCLVSGDRSQLKQVFVNLGKNGLEAMPDDGMLHIVLGEGPGPIEIRFEDEGPGIAPDEVDRIFEPFYTTKGSGVGMGLAICLRIVTAHDGTLRASSREGGGCTMTVSLPAARLEEALVRS